MFFTFLDLTMPRGKNKGKHRKRGHEEPEEESFKEYKKPRPTDAFGNVRVSNTSGFHVLLASS